MIELLNRLSWYNSDITQQDHELLEFVIKNNINSVRYLGECIFLKPIVNRESNDPEMCIFLVNQPFKFSKIVSICNQEIKKLPLNGFFYLAVNKFLALSEPQENIVDDYDDAIFNYVQKNVCYPIIKYYNGKDDYGQRFNWGHPITRFYFQHASSN